MMNRKYVFATHMGVGNRGCEGLTKSLCNLLELSPKKTNIYTKYYEEDISSTISQYGNLLCVNKWESTNILYRLFWKIVSLFNRDHDFLMLKKYDISAVTADDILLITGGDLYCYEGTVQLMGFIHRYAQKKGAASVLIGCSIEDKFLSEEVISDLASYDFITVRESLSYENLLKRGIEKNVYLIPDSAFVLLPEEVDVKIPSNVVGLNISPYVSTDNFQIFIQNVTNLLDYIMDHTDYNVMFIPHVFWEDQDDRKLIFSIYECYKKYNERVQVLDSEKLNYCQIRYVISKCKFFVGARTHSVISAYAMKVPTIALGYSVKARGIAKDIGMDPKTVVNCKELKNDKQLIESFLFLEENELEIKTMLKKNIPSYISDSGKIKNVWERWIRNELE